MKTAGVVVVLICGVLGLLLDIIGVGLGAFMQSEDGQRVVSQEMVKSGMNENKTQALSDTMSTAGTVLEGQAIGLGIVVFILIAMGVIGLKSNAAWPGVVGLIGGLVYLFLFEISSWFLGIGLLIGFALILSSLQGQRPPESTASSPPSSA